jgi:hypothetical protein
MDCQQHKTTISNLLAVMSKAQPTQLNQQLRTDTHWHGTCRTTVWVKATYFAMQSFWPFGHSHWDKWVPDGCVCKPVQQATLTQYWFFLNMYNTSTSQNSTSTTTLTVRCAFRPAYTSGHDSTNIHKHPTVLYTSGHDSTNIHKHQPSCTLQDMTELKSTNTNCFLHFRTWLN